MSSCTFDNSNAREFGLYSVGSIGWDIISTSRVVRPSVSLKQGTIILGGSGTATDPYIVG